MAVLVASLMPLFLAWRSTLMRLHAHHTPTGASWINQVERFFGLLSQRQIKRGVHRSVAALQAAITSIIEFNNAAPKPFRWTKTVDDILASFNDSACGSRQRNAANIRLGTLSLATAAINLCKPLQDSCPHSVNTLVSPHAGCGRPTLE